MPTKYLAIKEACEAISSDGTKAAKDIIETKYPFVPLNNEGRNYSDYQKTTIFLRDGFIDRYSGDRMIYPPVLRLLSTLMPNSFPYHKNWKTSECHIAYWQLFPTIDHVTPVSRGGADKEDNWVCTSQLRNSAKSNWSLNELGWHLHEPGNLNEWDGMINWFLDYINENPEALGDRYIKSWYNSTIRAIKHNKALNTELGKKRRAR